MSKTCDQTGCRWQITHPCTAASPEKSGQCRRGKVHAQQQARADGAERCKAPFTAATACLVLLLHVANQLRRHFLGRLARQRGRAALLAQLCTQRKRREEG